MNGFTAADMSTAAANGFRDGLAAQPAAAPVDDGMLPDALVPYSKEWYTLCERRFAVDNIKISGDLARAIVDAICQRPASIPAAPGIDPADPWRGLYSPELMPKLDGVNDWCAIHPNLPQWPDDDERCIDSLIKAQGFAFSVVGEEYPDEDDADGEEFDTCEWLANWKPEAPAGEHWRLVMVHDTEDGPAAVYVRPLALIDASPKGGQEE